jgi:multiple sugar transport system permease protein
MKQRNTLHNDFKIALLFMLPSFLGFIIFILVPIASSLALSFTNYSGSFRNIHLIGFKNYQLVLSDPKFWQSMSVTLVFVLISVTLQLTMGFIFALIVNKDLKGRVAFRSIIFLPTVLSSVAVCLSFLFIFHPTQGPINNFLKSINVPPIPWLADTSTALLTILIVFIWQFFGYYMVIFLSGLQTINPVLYEAADMDGASELRKLFHITIPGLSPVFFFCLIIAIINAFKTFDHIFIMTGGQFGGGPAGSTRVLAFDIYQNGFIFWQIGYGAAESVLLFIIVLFITIIQYRLQKKWVSYHVV